MRRWRDYRLTRLLGCPPSAWMNESAVRLDWLLACEDTDNAIQAAQARRSAARAAPRQPGPATMTGTGGGFNVG